MANNTVNQEAQMNMSFSELIQRERIFIPDIQRDYAQGRMDSKVTEIRNDFLADIEAVLSDDGKRLSIDFIYGSSQEITGSAKQDFIPLDGQQRLTTLFLLHWYFLPKDDKTLLVDNAEDVNVSCFSYACRTSSKDFCNKIVLASRQQLCEIKKKVKSDLQATIKNKLSELACLEQEKEKITLQQKIKNLEDQKKKTTLASVIRDQNWFAWEWNNDPTISSMLVMLDAIDEKFEEKDESDFNEYWKRLKNIIFNKLPLGLFNLTDELYVKMNARGKELSDFDKFKSTMEEQMRRNGVEENIQKNWREKIDGQWIDLFWNNISIDSNKTCFEQLGEVKKLEINYLRFLKEMILLYIFGKDVEKWASNVNLRDKKLASSIPWKDNIWEDDSWNNKPDEEKKAFLLNKLREYAKQNSDISKVLPLLYKTNFFCGNFYSFFITSMNNIVYRDNGKWNNASSLLNINKLSFENDSPTLFQALCAEKVTYEVRVQWHSILEFFKYHNIKDIEKCTDSDLLNEYYEWMRFIRNVSTYTNSYSFNNPNDLFKAIESITDLAKKVYSSKNCIDNQSDQNVSNSILSYLSTEQNKIMFFGDLINEERVKAKLKLSSKERWSDKINETENHTYFRGQIGFILKMAGVTDIDINLPLEEYKNEADKHFAQFSQYADIASEIFSGGYTERKLSKEALLERAILTIDSKYALIDKTWGNFLNTKSSESNVRRDHSWKRKFRDYLNPGKEFKCVKGVFNSIINRYETIEKVQISNYLQEIIDNYEQKFDETSLLIKYQYLMQHCKNGFFNHWNNLLILHGSVNYSAWDWEAFSVVLFKECMENKEGYEKFQYTTHNVQRENIPPHITANISVGQFRVTFSIFTEASKGDSYFYVVLHRNSTHEEDICNQYNKIVQAKHFDTLPDDSNRHLLEFKNKGFKDVANRVKQLYSDITKDLQNLSSQEQTELGTNDQL